MKNKIITIGQVLLCLSWAILTWNVEPVAWKIPTGFISTEQVWAVFVTIFTLLPAFWLQKFKAPTK